MFWDTLDGGGFDEKDLLLLVKAQASGLAWESDSHADVKILLKRVLFASQQSRCAYCRREIKDEQGRHEIDHVLPKSASQSTNNADSNNDLHRRNTFGYPQHRFLWKNLVLTCKRCNNRKGTYDSRADRTTPSPPSYLDDSDFIWVHPYLHVYSEHIEILDGLVFEAKGDDGKAVIRACGLDTLGALEVQASQCALEVRAGVSEKLMYLWSALPPLSNAQVAAMLVHEYAELEYDRVLEALEGNCGAPFERGARIVEILGGMLA